MGDRSISRVDVSLEMRERRSHLVSATSVAAASESAQCPINALTGQVAHPKLSKLTQRNSQSAFPISLNFTEFDISHRILLADL